MRERASMATTTRRAFLTRGERRDEIHIASVLVHARPEHVADLAARLSRLRGVEPHGSNGAGKLILTLETRGDAELMDRVRRIETAEGVIAASLVYHHAEEMGDDS